MTVLARIECQTPLQVAMGTYLDAETQARSLLTRDEWDELVAILGERFDKLRVDAWTRGVLA